MSNRIEGTMPNTAKAPKGFVLKNVLCNDMRGELLAIGYRYSEAKEIELGSRNKGLVIFFREENTLEWNYVKSFIITSKERLGLINPYSQSNIVRDIGYILSFPSPVVMDVFNLSSYVTEVEEKGLFNVSKVGIASFRVDLDIHDRRAKYERAYKAGVMYGFDYLIYSAMKYDNEADSLCSSTVPQDILMKVLI